MEKNFIEEAFEEADYDIPPDICPIKPSEIERDGDAIWVTSLGNPRRDISQPLLRAIYPNQWN